MQSRRYLRANAYTFLSRHFNSQAVNTFGTPFDADDYTLLTLIESIFVT